ncbi:MAG: PfkB family carbohydrate kinase [Planctomycetota bacterium]
MTARSASSKVCSVESLVELRRELVGRGERLVHCHGCFDLVHPGHVRHLQHAKSLGERLLVSITADAFVNKGDGRPLFRESLRAENLAELSCVDYVVVSPSPTAVDLLERVRPDVYVKGAEYEGNEDPRFLAERETVERHGGRVVFSSGDVVFSSTALIGALAGLGPAGEDADAFALRRVREAHGLDAGGVGRTLAGIRGKRVVVVGESIVDSYVECAWPELTGEAPMLSLRPIEKVAFDGGAAVVARHAAAMGAEPVLVTPLPRSVAAEAMVDRLESQGVTVEPIPTDSPLPEKERFLVGREKMVRLDRSRPIELDRRMRTRLVDVAASAAAGADAAVVTDYGLGVLGARLTGELFATLRPLVGVLAGDISGVRPSLLAMAGADWLSPSERELRGCLGQAAGSLPVLGHELLKRTGAKHAVVTMAGDGLVTFARRSATGSNDGHASRVAGDHLPALNKTPLDTLGCGDALLALGALAMTTGLEALGAAFVGSAAAAVCGSRIGNHAVTPGEIVSVVQRLEAAPPTIVEPAAVSLSDRAAG